MSTRKLVSFFEAAERTGVSYWTLWRGAEAGFFRTINLGGRRMISEAELDRILEEGFGARKSRGLRQSKKEAEVS